ncbi:MAG: outer membrane protein assembly factor BamB [Gallionella sp.]
MKVASLMLVLLLLGGCSTIKGWIGTVTPNAEAPSKLLEFNQSAQFTERWHGSFGDSGTNPLQAALTSDAVYGVSGEGELTRLDRATGRPVWRVDTKVLVSAGVGAGEGLVLIGSDKGEVLAYGEDGKLRWKHTVTSEVMGVPQVADGLVIVRSGDGYIAALEVKNGKQRWNYAHKTPALVVRSHASVTAHRGVIYAGFAGGALIAMSVRDGSSVWENAVSQPRGSTELERISDITSNPVLNDDEVCAIAFQGRLACFDAKQGSPLWNRKLASDKGLFIYRRDLYLSDFEGVVIALDKVTGSTVWKNSLLRFRHPTAPYVQDNFVVVGDYAGYLHGLSRSDGRFVARINLDSSAIDVAPIAMDDGLLVKTRSGGIYSLSLH